MMALKQGTGLILIAGFEEISIEWPHFVQKWKNADNLSETITATCEHLKLALTRAFTRLKENAKLLNKFSKRLAPVFSQKLQPSLLIFSLEL